MARVFIGRLSDRASERDVERFFKGYGRIKDIRLKSGYGFVEFDSERDADDAIHDLHHKELAGGRVVLEHARSGRRSPRRFDSRRFAGNAPIRTDYRLLVENLPSRVSWQDLKDLMRKTGEVMFADAHKRRQNEGIVEFKTRADMKAALKKFDGYEISGRKLRVYEDNVRGRTATRSRSQSSRSASYRKSRKRSNRRSSSSRRRSSRRSSSRSKSYETRHSSSILFNMSNKPPLVLAILLLVFSIAIFIVISIIVIIKRQVSVVRARNSKAGYTAIGHGLPKNVRESVEQEINATRRVYVEPKIFTEEYEDNIDEYLSRKDITYIYRLKAVEEYKELVPLIKLFTNNGSSTKSNGLSKEMTELISACSDLYTHARRSYKPFTEEHYKQFSQIKERLLRIFTSRKNSIQKNEPSTSRRDDDRITQTNRHSHSVDSIDSQTALIEIDNKETQMVEDNSINNLHENLMGCVTSRFSKSTNKKAQDIAQSNC